MKSPVLNLVALLILSVLSACSDPASSVVDVTAHSPENSDERGPNNGRLLRSGNFELELAIFETGVPPEYRAWARVDGQPVSPEAVQLNVELTRLGGIVDRINFAPQGDALRGDTVIYEPHSFSVNVTAQYQGARHQWQYDSFEGRTRIEPEIVAALGIATEIAGPGIIDEQIPVYGRIVADSDAVTQVSARFDGPVHRVYVALGDRVNAGDRLAEIESNESLTRYTLTAPASGIITAKQITAGEQSAGRTLFTITDTTRVWADLSVFPADQQRVQTGQSVRLDTGFTGLTADGVIDRFLPGVDAGQAITARVALDNSDGRLQPGQWVQGHIKVDEHLVDLAVRREGLQSFRDFTVVYAQIGDEFEVRMLELGRQSSDWVEVLGGLTPGTRYVTENSYILKADVEKDGASHDH